MLRRLNFGEQEHLCYQTSQVWLIWASNHSWTTWHLEYIFCIKIKHNHLVEIKSGKNPKKKCFWQLLKASVICKINSVSICCKMKTKKCHMGKTVREWSTAPPGGDIACTHVGTLNFKTKSIIDHLKQFKEKLLEYIGAYTELGRGLNIPVLTPQIKSNSL